MIKSSIFAGSRNSTRGLASEENPAETYGRIDLTPSTLETLVTWDVCVHAQREQDRLTSAWRMPGAIHGAY